VADSFSDFVKTGKDLLLMITAPWCVVCKEFNPVYEELARQMKVNPNIVVAKIDGI
jgi:thiol-disulfide isomerase/thioredoxin